MRLRKTTILHHQSFNRTLRYHQSCCLNGLQILHHLYSVYKTFTTLLLIHPQCGLLHPHRHRSHPRHPRHSPNHHPAPTMPLSSGLRAHSISYPLQPVSELPHVQRNSRVFQRVLDYKQGCMVPDVLR
jgi:hypothetical protein